MCTYDFGDYFAFAFVLFLLFIAGWASGWNAGRKEGFNIGFHRGRSLNFIQRRDDK
jgi:hypothetical protein